MQNNIITIFQLRRIEREIEERERAPTLALTPLCLPALRHRLKADELCATPELVGVKCSKASRRRPIGLLATLTSATFSINKKGAETPG